jgi:hypothetical protein
MFLPVFTILVLCLVGSSSLADSVPTKRWDMTGNTRSVTFFAGGANPLGGAPVAVAGNYEVSGTLGELAGREVFMACRMNLPGSGGFDLTVKVGKKRVAREKGSFDSSNRILWEDTVDLAKYGPDDTITCTVSVTSGSQAPAQSSAGISLGFEGDAEPPEEAVASRHGGASVARQLRATIPTAWPSHSDGDTHTGGISGAARKDNTKINGTFMVSTLLGESAASAPTSEFYPQIECSGQVTDIDRSEVKGLAKVTMKVDGTRVFRGKANLGRRHPSFNYSSFFVVANALDLSGYAPGAVVECLVKLRRGSRVGESSYVSMTATVIGENES